MIASPISRVIVWTAGTLGLAGLTGDVSFMGQTVNLPLWAVLALTFIPTSDLIEVAQSGLDRLENRLKRDKKPDK